MQLVLSLAPMTLVWSANRSAPTGIPPITTDGLAPGKIEARKCCDRRLGVIEYDQGPSHVEREERENGGGREQA
jgi:hypothetical protein